MTCRCTGPTPGGEPSTGGQFDSFIERTVKYIANSAAKNISSEDSQTMVPTETMDGLVRAACGGASSRASAATACILARTRR